MACNLPASWRSKFGAGLPVLQLDRPQLFELSEWIVAAAAMFGAFNKYMDGLGIPLEEKAYAETIHVLNNTSIGKAGRLLSSNQRALPPPIDDWSLVLGSLVQVFRPGGALALDTKLHGDTPHSKAGCLEYLQEKTGAFFGLVLERLQGMRPIRAVTAVIAKNTDSATSTLSVSTKAAMGIQFCNNDLENPRLAKELQKMADRVASEDRTSNGHDDKKLELIRKVTKAVSYTSNRVSEKLVQE